ncbi:MAG: ribosomal protein L7/L12 [Nitrospira sp.]
MITTTAPREDLSAAAIAALMRGSKIEAIKIVRQDRSSGLKEAKDLVDVYVQSQPALKQKMEDIQAQSRQSFLRFLILLAAVGAVVAYFVMQGK